MRQANSRMIAAALAGMMATAAPAQQEAPQEEAAAPAETPVTAETVLATVNGREITAGHLHLLRAQLPQQYQALPLPELYEGLLGQAVQQALLADTVDELGMVGRMEQENSERILRAGIAIARLSDEVVTDAAVQEAYAEQYGSGEPTEEFRASHILLETEEKALEVKGMIDEGGDFAALAREHSTGPSGPNGGDLGWFSSGMMVPEFEAAVLALEPGAVSQPVQTQFGWHLVKLQETRVQPVPPLEQVRSDIEQELRETAVQERLAELEADAELSRLPAGSVSPDFLNDPDLLSE